MEKERQAHEKEEEAKKAKANKIKEEFADAGTEWEQDKQEMQRMQREKLLAGKVQGSAQKAEAVGSDGQRGKVDKVQAV